jgi:quercetin dioxygenase-like cupin family protein
MKNISELHGIDKEVSAVNLFKSELGTTTAIHLQKNATLKEHVTKTPALLLCISGVTTYKDETETEAALKPGDYVMISPNVKHWLYASEQSQLILLK